MKFVNCFRTWALKEYSEFENERKKAYVKSGMGGMDERYHWHSYGNKIIILDMKTGKTAFARCKKGDEFSSVIGVGIAWARLKSEEIPVEYKTVRLKDLNTKDKFVIVSNNDEEIYTYVGRIKVDSIDKCFYAAGKKLEKLMASEPDTVVIKL